MADGKITGYNYLDGRELFTEDQKVNFEDILKKYQVMYQTQGAGDNVKFIVDDSDIPSSEVLMYMIKEGWFFDEATGSFKSQVIALCPMLIREDYYYGSVTKNPLFWLPYEEIRPYISRELIMTSNFNNALTYTIDDYFMKHMYSGDIVKTTNLMNRSLAQEVGEDPEAQKHAQDSIENQLKEFNQKLWVYNDSIAKAEVEAKNSKTTKKTKETKETKSAARGSGAKEKKEKEQKSKSSSNSENNSSTTRSVRRNR
jgi:gliding motility associated protien GldN